MKCTYLEIYNEQLIDLLNDAKPVPLTIREDAKRVYVENLTEVTTSSYQEVLSLM
jgi:kinesin family protein 15